jgi:hypothetical protein
MNGPGNRVVKMDDSIPIGYWRSNARAEARCSSALRERSGAAIAVVALHLSLFAPLLRGNTQYDARRFIHRSAGENARALDGHDAEALILVNIQEPRPQIDPQHLAFQDLNAPLRAPEWAAVGANPLPPIDVAKGSEDPPSPAESVPDSVDSMAQYLGTLQKAIEAHWSHPSTATLGANAVSVCKLQLSVTSSGVVNNVKLADCGSNPSWEESAVMAAFRSSPLPVAPDPILVQNIITLSLVATTIEDHQ